MSEKDKGRPDVDGEIADILDAAKPLDTPSVDAGEDDASDVRIGPDEGEDIDWPRLKECALEPETDIGNGRRFLIRHREKVIYVPQVGWHLHDGRRFAEDNDGRLVRPLSHATVEAIAMEVLCIQPTKEEQQVMDDADAGRVRHRELAAKGKGRTPEETTEQMALEALIDRANDIRKGISSRRQARRRYCKTSGSSGKVDNMMKEAAPYVSVPVGDLDADPLAVNCKNGTLRFIQNGEGGKSIWTARLDKHFRDDLISKLLPVDYREDAECPAFLSFLDRVMPDEEMRGFLQRFLGYCLTGLTREQVFCFFYGKGRNGKSTLVDLVAQIMADYSATVPFETLAGDDRRKASEATPELARLPGVRLVRASEPEQRMEFRESMVKSLTSSEPILVRRLHQDFNEIYPAFKLIVSGNHKPTIKGTDDGIWRRVLLVPWEVQIPDHEVDKALPKRLWAERDGIFAWMVAGALSYLEEGLRVPDAVRAATDDYREESDPVGAFLKEACDVTSLPSDVVTPGELYDAFAKYAKAQSFTVWQPTTFNRQLPLKAAQFGFTKSKTNGLSVYRGISIKPAFGPSVTPGWD
ncbi:hypothetical protein H2509_20320 [Stappia sp. F7233]|uniref:SF3 helicase domain-containing protein n=1 Tax=Stappia albiluteola TaxID=2758565 RepID=A0A839AKT6_9HYPH|nr:phage/plasmid primase, P4 family [Stappia albiluteola]MBA5779482.1 hypothetical protein [Stappia albiluteola]